MADEFPVGTILANFDLQVTPMLPAKFQVNWPFGSGNEAKIDFQDGRQGDHLGFSIGTSLAFLDLQVTPMLPIKFGVNLPRGVGRVGVYLKQIVDVLLRAQMSYKAENLSDRNAAGRNCASLIQL